jgi:hypothetical protein
MKNVELEDIFCPSKKHSPKTDSHVVCSFCYTNLDTERNNLQKKVAHLEEEKEALTDLLIKEHQKYGVTERS